jgi:hypothetical protein
MKERKGKIMASGHLDLNRSSLKNPDTSSSSIKAFSFTFKRLCLTMGLGSLLLLSRVCA